MSVGVEEALLAMRVVNSSVRDLRSWSSPMASFCSLVPKLVRSDCGRNWLAKRSASPVWGNPCRDCSEPDAPLGSRCSGHPISFLASGRSTAGWSHRTGRKGAHRLGETTRTAPHRGNHRMRTWPRLVTTTAGRHLPLRLRNRITVPEMVSDADAESYRDNRPAQLIDFGDAKWGARNDPLRTLQ